MVLYTVTFVCLHFHKSSCLQGGVEWPKQTNKKSLETGQPQQLVPTLTPHLEKTSLAFSCLICQMPSCAWVIGWYPLPCLEREKFPKSEWWCCFRADFLKGPWQAREYYVFLWGTYSSDCCPNQSWHVCVATQRKAQLPEHCCHRCRKDCTGCGNGSLSQDKVFTLPSWKLWQYW